MFKRITDRATQFGVYLGETCSYERLRAGQPCTFKFNASEKLDMTFTFTLDTCEGGGDGADSALPFFHWGCEGLGCDTLLKPCTGDADCGGTAGSCRDWGMSGADWSSSVHGWLFNTEDGASRDGQCASGAATDGGDYQGAVLTALRSMFDDVAMGGDHGKIRTCHVGWRDVLRIRDHGCVNYCGDNPSDHCASSDKCEGADEDKCREEYEGGECNGWYYRRPKWEAIREMNFLKDRFPVINAIEAGTAFQSTKTDARSAAAQECFDATKHLPWEAGRRCHPGMVGDQRCQPACNIEACNFDGGDCRGGGADECNYEGGDCFGQRDDYFHMWSSMCPAVWPNVTYVEAGWCSNSCGRWEQAPTDTKDLQSYCNNLDKYVCGYHSNWYISDHGRKACPDGWHQGFERWACPHYDCHHAEAGAPCIKERDDGVGPDCDHSDGGGAAFRASLQTFWDKSELFLTGWGDAAGVADVLAKKDGAQFNLPSVAHAGQGTVLWHDCDAGGGAGSMGIRLFNDKLALAMSAPNVFDHVAAIARAVQGCRYPGLSDGEFLRHWIPYAGDALYHHLVAPAPDGVAAQFAAAREPGPWADALLAFTDGSRAVLPDGSGRDAWEADGRVAFSYVGLSTMVNADVDVRLGIGRCAGAARGANLPSFALGVDSDVTRLLDTPTTCTSDQDCADAGFEGDQFECTNFDRDLLGGREDGKEFSSGPGASDFARFFVFGDKQFSASDHINGACGAPAEATVKLERKLPVKISRSIFTHIGS